MTIIALLLLQLMSIAVPLVDGQNPLSIDLFMRNFTMDKPRGTADARYDLPLYMSGIWEIQMGEQSFLNYIWQECLEMTISGPGAPIHHMIHNGEYLTEDVYGEQFVDKAGEYAAWKSVLAEPTSIEKSFGAKATSVFYVDNTIQGYENLADGEYLEAAIRFIGSDGSFYFQQNCTELGAGCSGMTPNGIMVLRFTKKDNLPCSYPFEPETDYCIEKQSTYKLENASSFTPACCGYGYCGNTSAYLLGAGPFDKVGDCTDERSQYCDVWTEDEDEDSSMSTTNDGATKLYSTHFFGFGFALLLVFFKQCA